MSWSQRFMNKKGGAEAQAEWRSTEAAGGSWQTVGRQETAGGGWQRAAGGGGGSGSWQPKAPEPKPVLNTNSEEQFPSLGRPKPRPTAEQARLQGFAALAASWASQDAAEAAEAKRLRDEAQKEEEKRAKEAAQFGLLECIMRRRNEGGGMASGGYGGYSSAVEDASDVNYERSYSPHSPTYPPYDEEIPAAASNPHFAYDRDEEEGWTSR